MANIVDAAGVNLAAVSAAGALKVDGSAVTQPVSGTVSATQGTSPWVVSLASTSITGTVAVTQSTSPWVVSLASTTITGTVAVTQSTSPWITTANIGTTGGLALDATLTGGTQKAIVRGGAKGTTTAADVTSSASGANHQTLDVAIYDAAGNQITTFGGGQQYADGAARGTATGTLAMGDDGTNIQSVSVDSTGKLNINNISGTVSLPTGAATAANQTNGTQATRITDGTDTMLVNADGSINVTGSFSATSSADQSDGFAPDPASRIVGTANLLVDSEQHLVTRGQILTDEGSFRDDFPGTALLTGLTGTISFTGGGTAVTGVGTLFTSQLLAGQYIRLTAHANTALTRIASIESDTALTLDSGYAGATGSGAASESNWLIAIGTGATQTVLNSILTLASGTTSGSVNSVCRMGDYGPYNRYCSLSLSQRIANQSIIVGFVDSPTAITKGAYFLFDGTTNTTVKCVSQSSANAADITTLTVTLPSGLTTATAARYEVDVTGDNATFLVNGIGVARLTDHLPGPYDVLMVCSQVTNTGVPASSTSVRIDYDYFSNVDQIEVTSNFAGSPLNVQSPIGQPVLKTGTLVTTAVSADQVVLTYTVTTGKTLYLKYVGMSGYITTLPGNANPIRLGAISLETPSGTKVITVDRFHAPTTNDPFPFDVPITSGTVVRVVVTPAAATSYTWRANFGGYEL